MLRNVFSEMDTDVSGSVSLAEFQEVYACLSLAVTSEESDTFLSRFHWSARDLIAYINVIG